MNELSQHLEDAEIDCSWFLIDMLVCLFVHKLSNEAAIAVWDIMFITGQARCAFGVILAFFDTHQEALLMIPSTEKSY